MTINITSCGASPYGSLCTQAIQRAIDLCPVGGTVVVPAGVFVTGALWLKSDLTLRLERGGRLLGSANPADYPIHQEHYEGYEQLCYGSLLSTGPARYRNITIEGEGCIDANGIRLFPAEMDEARARRGKALSLRNIDGLTIRGVTICDSAFWCAHLLYCRDVLVEDAHIASAWDAEGRRNTLLYNGDGLDLESCERVTVRRCLIESQDDCLAVKSGRDAEGRRVGLASRDVLVEDCRFRSGFGVAVGSEMAGGVEGVTVRRCTFEDSFSIASIKGVRGRGGFIRHIRFEDCALHNTSHAVRPTRWFKGILYIDSSYGQVDFDPDVPRPVDETTPAVEDLAFERITGETVEGWGLYLCGLPERPIRGVSLKDVRLTAPYTAYRVNAECTETDTVYAGKDGDVTYREQCWLEDGYD